MAAPAHSVSGALTDFGDTNFQTAVVKPLSTPAAHWNSVFRWAYIGDSHTAGDYLTGELRRRLQQRYGNAGIGWISPGYVANQRSEEVLLSNEGGWSVQRSARRRSGIAEMPFGGHVGMGNTLASAMRITFKDSPAPQLMRLSLLQPAAEYANAGLEVNAGGRATYVSAATAQPRSWAMTSVLLDSGNDRLWLKTLPKSTPDKAVLAGMALEKLSPGVVLDTVGVNGAQIDEFLAWNKESTAAFFSTRPHNLIALAFGTNESVSRNFDRAQFVAKITSAVRRIRQTSHAAIMLVLPPDVRIARPTNGTRLAGCGQPTPYLAQVNESLYAVARQEKTLLWDWGSWIRAHGGNCGLISLAYMTPPLAQPDFIHLTPDGYRASATALLDDLLHLAGVRIP